MRGFIRKCAMALAMWAGMSAANATVTYTIDATGSTPLTGSFGNSYTGTFGVGDEAVSYKITGWSLSGLPTSNSTTIGNSYVGQWSAGFGVTSTGDNSGKGNLHAVDNKGRYDFLVIQFDKEVTLESFKVTPYQISGLSYVDTDATYGFGNTVWGSSPFSGSNAAAFNSVFAAANRTTDSTNSNSARSISIGSGAGNTWLIGARMTQNDNEYDAFKVDQIKFNFTPIPAVPEPSTWMMMILGFGFVGSTMRRRQPTQAALAA